MVAMCSLKLFSACSCTKLSKHMPYPDRIQTMKKHSEKWSIAPSKLSLMMHWVSQAYDLFAFTMNHHMECYYLWCYFDTLQGRTESLFSTFIRLSPLPPPPAHTHTLVSGELKWNLFHVILHTGSQPHYLWLNVWPEHSTALSICFHVIRSLFSTITLLFYPAALLICLYFLCVPSCNPSSYLLY